MADPSQQPVIIIRRKKGGGHGGHHGGAWKVAYADFVTAMMAFFLLLWLLNVTTDVQRKGIADYFAPASISKSESGAGGVMGGQTITINGAQISASSPPTVDDRTIPTVGMGEQGEEDTVGKSDKVGDGGKGANSKDANAKNSVASELAALGEAMQREEQHFKEAEQLLKTAINGIPEFKEFADQILVDRTTEGLRIQIIDRDKFSMFPSGGSVPFERGRDLLRMVGKVIARLPNNISVTGHTDSAPFSSGSRRDNWSLSSERANVSRGELMAGMADMLKTDLPTVEPRIARVVGMADRDPLAPNDPKAPQNRRISIVLLRQAIPPAETMPATPEAAPVPISAPAKRPPTATP